MTEPHRLSLRKRLLFAAVVVIGPLATGEIAARLWAADQPARLIRAPLDGTPQRDQGAFFRDHPRLFFELRPDVDEPFGHWGDRTDSLGLRNRVAPGPKDGRTRVVCLGDSTTYGIGLPLDATWPALLGRDPRYDVVNAGVPGYTTFQARVLYEEKCAALEPDVLVIGFGNNEPSPWPTRQDGRTLCLSDAERAEHLRYALRPSPSALVRWLSGVVTLSRPEEVEGDWDEVLPHARPRVGPEEFRADLRELCGLAPRCLLVIWPHRRDFVRGARDPVPAERLETYRQVVRDLGAEGFPVLDLRGAYSSSGAPPDALFQDYVHPTRAGARIVAAAVAGALRE